MLDSLVRVSRRVGWVADIAADPVRSAPLSLESGVTDGTPPARRRDDARGALRTVRPDPGTPEEGGEVGERSRRGRGGPASTRRRGGERGDGLCPVPSAPGFGELLLPRGL